MGQVLLSQQADSLRIYSRDANLRLDFRVDNHSGQIAIESPGRRYIIDLYAPAPGIASIYPNHNPVEVVGTQPFSISSGLSSGDETVKNTPVERSPGPTPDGGFSTRDLVWLEQQQRNPRPLSLNHPDWRGILASARELFDNIYLLPDELDKERGHYYASLISAAGCPSVTIQGFPRTYEYLVKALRKIAPQIPVYLIYHGNFLHMREDYDWQIFKRILSLHQEGDLVKVGFVKQGMAEILQAAGVKASFIMNMVREIPSGPSQPLSGGIHVGIWGQPDWSWKKSPYAMQAALRLVEGSIGHVYNVSPRAREFGSLLGIRGEYYADALPQSQVREAMSAMHLNLYVTLTECAPMMPLESLAVGVPCLFGPTSHYFLDDAYLHSRLVVPMPDDARVIAEFANQAILERDEIIRAYQAYAPGNNRRAQQVLAEFLEFPLDNS